MNTRTGEIINPDVWKAVVKPGSRISMAITIVSLSNAKRHCPCCDGVKKRNGSNGFSTW